MLLNKYLWMHRIAPQYDQNIFNKSKKINHAKLRNLSVELKMEALRKGTVLGKPGRKKSSLICPCALQTFVLKKYEWTHSLISTVWQCATSQLDDSRQMQLCILKGLINGRHWGKTFTVVHVCLNKEWTSLPDFSQHIEDIWMTYLGIEDFKNITKKNAS